MGLRFTYSRWDGTQKGFELDADSLMRELTDELIHHGDPNAALRRIMQQGIRDRNGRNIEGIRQALDRIRNKRKEIRERGNIGHEFDDVARELDDIVDEERLAVDSVERAAMESGDTRRADVARESAMDRRLRLDMLPDDLARKIEALSHYDFQSPDAQLRFERLSERLKDQLSRRQFEQVASGIESITPEALARMNEMMKALNDMIERRQRGEDPQFEEFMKKFGEFFPENPATLDELLELIAKRMAAAQAILNSMTPEQRAELQELTDQMLGDNDVREQIRQRLLYGEPALEEVAELLGMTSWSLQRRLREQGLSFSQLVDNVRRELANRYLREPQLPISQLALLLGYSETSAFSRAFRRWFGISPRQWRREGA